VKKAGFIVIFAILLAFTNLLKAQEINPYLDSLFLKFDTLYNSCDLVNAEASMIHVLDLKEWVPDGYLVSAYNNLGVVNNLLGRYKESLTYYDKAEVLINSNPYSLRRLAIIYSNKSRIFNIQKKYSTAIEYLEKGLRIYQEINNPDKGIFRSISTSYMNMGLSYYGQKDFTKAMNYFEKCTKLKLKYNLSELGLCYMNIANTYVETGDTIKAENFFIKSIAEFEKGSDVVYQRIIDVYFGYGNFLRSSGREKEALDYHTQALSLSLKNFGKKHPYVSLAYKYLGDHYSGQSDYTSALQYYQEALIALVSNFDNPDINTNPSLDSALLDADLLKILQKKSEAWEMLSLQQNNPRLAGKSLEKSLETIELALQLITRIRNEYITEDSRLYLMENEKESYIYAVHITQKLYMITSDPAFLQKIYGIARQAKSAVLHNEITDNQLLYSIGIPDTLLQKHNSAAGDMAAYNYMIHEEAKNARPDKKKTDFWKDALFETSREKERIDEDINARYPQYRDLMQKTEPISLAEIQNHLQKNETLIEYLLSNKYSNGKRALYIFTVTNKNLHFKEIFLDTLFVKNAATIKYNSEQVLASDDYREKYTSYASALFAMYEDLIRPVENDFAGSKLIIIPDEEIAYLPFDAFIKNEADTGQASYEGLEYLVKSYSISYGYSSSLVFRKDKEIVKAKEVYSFSPDYDNSNSNSSIQFESLSGAVKETDAIYRYFHGEQFAGDRATESNFKTVLNYPAVFHLAMHSLTDTSNSKYSCLVFDTRNDSADDGKLYDYEISLSRISSPMVVLSACNTGSGILYHGEGVMSITRAFLLAGASSVIKTLWDVNDDASAKIIAAFYYHLSTGKEKDDALRLAKLEYLESSVPGYTNPYYWAAYQVMGDKSPITKNKKTAFLVAVFILILFSGGIGIAHFRRRRSLSA
jgi:CHAT domain-containing protein/Tfp pilus assembly protein PilF